jgi:hypothetical protein
MVTQTKIDVGYKGLKTIEGLAPDHFDGSFYCSHNKLESLKGAPSYIGGGFYSNNCSLKTLEGAPRKVEEDFSCFNNDISTLDGAPEFIGERFICHSNNLTSLHNIHKQIKHIGGYVSFENNPIKSHVLGLLLIDGLKGVWMDHLQVETILNDHIQGDRDIFACQEELIEAGLEDFAKL